MKRVRILLLTAALGSAVAACGSGGGTRSQGTPTPSPTAFALQEWSITAPTTQLRAGNVVVTATNRGSETHELVIVRTDDAASLPTKSDGSVDEDKIPETSKPGEIADIKAGTTVTKTIDLASGNYVAICNLVDTMGQGGGMGGMGNGNGGGMTGGQMGHVHYQLGMVVRFTVA
jgi:hypothetical protein